MLKCIDTDWFDMTAWWVHSEQAAARPAPLRSRRGHLAMPCRRQARFNAAQQRGSVRRQSTVCTVGRGCMQSLLDHGTNFVQVFKSGLAIVRGRTSGANAKIGSRGLQSMAELPLREQGP